MKKRVLLFGGVGIVLVTVVLVVFLVVIPNISKSPLVGCEYEYEISKTESYKISFRKDKVVLYHNYMMKNGFSPTGYSLDTDKSDWQEFDYQYVYDGEIEVFGMPIFYSTDPITKDITFRDVEFLDVSKNWEFFQKLD